MHVPPNPQNQRLKRPAPEGKPATSDLLANRYVLEEKIADGGMAAVWRAHDEVLARTVAIKILHEDLSRHQAIRERFRREAIAAAKLVHPGIVSLFDTGIDDGRVYLVIEYIEGQTLASVIAAEVLDPGEVARIGGRIAAALSHAHGRGIIHRDIKPANVLLADDGAVKVTDFGIAKAARDATLTATGRVMGTAAYVAPEQLQGHLVDARADLYSLGLVLYEAVTGRRAFKGDDPVAVAQARLGASAQHPRRLRADIPRGFDQVIGALTAPEPNDRPRSAAEVVELLRPWGTLPVSPPAVDLAEPPGDDDGTIRSELRWLVPVATLLALAAALVGVGILGGVIEDDRMTSVTAKAITPTPQPPAVVDNDDDDAEPEPPATESVPLTNITAFDPQGDSRQERDELLANLTDGAPDTAWATEQYNTPAFGNLKSGVGFHVDLGGPRVLTEVILDVPRGGFNLELRVSGRPDPDPAAWQPGTTIPHIGPGRTAYPLTETPQARYLLVWITGDLQPYQRWYRAEIGEIQVKALAS